MLYSSVLSLVLPRLLEAHAFEQRVPFSLAGLRTSLSTEGSFSLCKAQKGTLNMSHLYVSMNLLAIILRAGRCAQQAVGKGERNHKDTQGLDVGFVLKKGRE